MLKFNPSRFYLSFSTAIIILLISGCSAMPQVSRASYDTSASDGSPEGRLITKHADINLEVEEITSIDEKVRRIVKDKSGYIASSRLDTKKRYSAELKIPTNELDSTLTNLASLGKELSRKIDSRDVTDEMIDQEAALTNLMSLRGRMRELLAKATTVDEIMKVEQELNRIQTQIDTFTGRLKALKSQVAYATINVSAAEKTIYGPLGYIGMGVIWLIESLFVIK